MRTLVRMNMFDGYRIVPRTAIQWRAMRTLLYYLLLSVVISALILSLLLASGVVAPPEPAQPVEYTVLHSDEYQSLIKNWDETVSPVLCAYIRSIDDYRTVFIPSPRNNGTAATEPDSSFFETGAMLVIAWVQSASHDPHDVFEIEHLMKYRGELVLDYRYNEKMDTSSLFVIRYVTLRIQPAYYPRIVLVQNRRKYGQIDLRGEKEGNTGCVMSLVK